LPEEEQQTQEILTNPVADSPADANAP